jgi:hypothetical protein
MMKATVLLKCLLLGSLALLTACGGGGGSGDDNSFGPISSARISASAASTSVPAGGTLAVSVVVSNSNNTPIADGTTVSAGVSPSNLGGIFGVLNGSPTNLSSATTVGGRAEFVFVTTSSEGAATLTFSTQPLAQGGAVTASLAITVTPPAATGNVTIEATRTQLPANVFGVAPFFGSPYITEITINARTASGQPISIPRGDAGGLGVSINPVTVAAFSTLDDPSTQDINEFTSLLGQGPVNLVAGRATIFVHSFNVTGQATVTATVQDPETNRSMTATRVITVTSTAPPLPATLNLLPSFSNLYVQGSGAQTSGTLQVELFDGIGQPAPDPAAGNASFNNLRVEVLGAAAASANERVSAVNAAGQTVTGQAISIRTTGGIATFTLISGNRLGQSVVRVTADRADNNVDNGISDPLVTERTVSISDGRLFALQLTSPASEAIEENRVLPGQQGLEGGQNGTYSLTVSALATDRQGNPVLPGTLIEFGLVDSPLTGFPSQGRGAFPISGGDGNPQENGFTFTAVTGAFQTAGGGAGPGDTLLVFGQSVPGNRDLESARSIAQINGQGSLSVVQRFNSNDDTGSSVDAGGVLPYVIGRAIHGNIVGSAFTDANGVATTRLNFPISRIGQSVIVWTRGSVTVGNTQKLVSDIEGYVYPGIGPLSIIASPGSIPGNTTASVTVCLRDSLNSPLQGAFIDFGFSLANGIGTIAGQSGGQLPQPTGSNGCVVVSVVTSGMSTDGSNVVTFSVGDAEPAEVEIRVAADLILQASPTAFIGDGTYQIDLRLIDGAGNPVAGRAISVQCSGSGVTATVSVITPPTLTNASGNSTAVVRAALMDQPDGGAEWTCEFALAGGQPSASVLFKGRDSCAGGGGFSPPPPPTSCGTTGTTVNFTLNLSGAPGGTVTGSGGQICSAPASGTVPPCVFPVPSGTIVSMTVTPASPRPPPTVSGACQLSPLVQAPGATYSVVSSTISSAQSCSIVF